MDTQNQLQTFAICLLVGYIGGLLYEPFGLLRIAFGCPRGKAKGVGMALDTLYFAALALMATLAAYLFHFPALRVYMWVGYILGGILYLKSLHKIIAFFENMCYNGIRNKLKKAKKREKTLSKKESRV